MRYVVCSVTSLRPPCRCLAQYCSLYGMDAELSAVCMGQYAGEGVVRRSDPQKGAQPLNVKMC